MSKYVFALFFIPLFLTCSTALALSEVDRVWQCADWDPSDVGPARCSLVEDGYQVHISGKPYTLYSVVKFPGEARYFQKWDVVLESKLGRGAMGIAIGNDRTGLIFQVSDRNVAEIRFYAGRQAIVTKLSKHFAAGGDDRQLAVRYDIKEGRCVFRVNGETVFDIRPGEMSNLPMTSSVQQVAVTSTLPDCRRNASILHKSVRVHAR